MTHLHHLGRGGVWQPPDKLVLRPEQFRGQGAVAACATKPVRRGHASEQRRNDGIGAWSCLRLRCRFWL
eukprot:COSAG01_NODE_7274_length_3274_cov_2.216063_2_plen_69_part_00